VFGKLVQRGRERAQARAAARRRELAARLAEAAPGGVEMESEGEAVVLRGRGIARRFATEAELRWLVTEVRDGG
jgi:hypothetical protein